MANLGFIGLGIMGKPMAGHLLDAKHTVHVYDVVAASVKELTAKVSFPVAYPCPTPSANSTAFSKSPPKEASMLKWFM